MLMGEGGLGGCGGGWVFVLDKPSNLVRAEHGHRRQRLGRVGLRGAVVPGVTNAVEVEVETVRGALEIGLAGSRVTEVRGESVMMRRPLEICRCVKSIACCSRCMASSPFRWGMVRSMKVALMAKEFGKSCTPHMSGGDLGFLYMMHFASAIPNGMPHHEFKGFRTNIVFECPTSPLQSDRGVVKVPGGPGSGVDIDPGFLAKFKLVDS